MTNTYNDEIRQHYERVWNSRAIVKRWTQGPVHQLPKDFCVAEFEPRADSHTWEYGTCCMSQPGDQDPIELHLFAPSQDDAHAELLTFICHYHRTGSRLGLGHTVNFGRPWLPASTCSYGLISLPYLDGPILEIFRSTISGKNIQFLWLIPITEQEREYKKEHGLEALEIQLEKAQVNYLDPMRASVV